MVEIVIGDKPDEWPPLLQDSEAYLDSVARADAEEEKQCWVCFANEEDDPTAVWVHPCKYVLLERTANSTMPSESAKKILSTIIDGI